MYPSMKRSSLLPFNSDHAWARNGAKHWNVVQVHSLRKMRFRLKHHRTSKAPPSDSLQCTTSQQAPWLRHATGYTLVQKNADVH